jgi:hypothetical protein
MGHDGASKRRRSVKKARSLSSGMGNSNNFAGAQPVEISSEKLKTTKKSVSSKDGEKKNNAIVKKKDELASKPVKSKATEKPVTSKKDGSKSAEIAKQKNKTESKPVNSKSPNKSVSLKKSEQKSSAEEKKKDKK